MKLLMILAACLAVIFTSLTPALASLPPSAGTARVTVSGACSGTVKGEVFSQSWQTEWKYNPGNCGQQAAGKCANPQRTQFVWEHGNWRTALYGWSYANCPGSYPVLVQGNINVKNGLGYTCYEELWPVLQSKC